MQDSSLSCIRLVATVMIFSCHIFQGLNLEIAWWLNLGVQIFFILSGYLYSKKDIKDVKEFYEKRYRRIMIPYIILLLIILIIMKIDNVKEFPSISVIVLSLMGFQNLISPINILSHTWFISYILLGYLFTPVLKMYSKIVIKKPCIKD